MAKQKSPSSSFGLIFCGGERGIRTPVTVFAVNMISNFSRLLKCSIKSDFFRAINSRLSCIFTQSVVKSVVSFFPFRPIEPFYPLACHQPGSP